MRTATTGRWIHSAAVFLPVLAAAALAGCPMQPTYSPTITPIYAGNSVGDLNVYNGSSWTSIPFGTVGAGNAPITGVVVFGSGSGATIYVGGTGGVSRFNGSAWGLILSGSGATKSLSASSAVYASTTTGGLSMLNPDGASWSTNGAVTPLDAFFDGAQTFVATGASANLTVYNGPGLVGTGTPLGGPGGNVTSVFEDFSGDLIVGTATNVVGVRFAGTSGWQTFSTATSVSHVYADLFGDVYATTSNGLYVADLVNSTVTVALSGTVNCVCVDGKGIIYAGTPTGLEISQDGGSRWTTQLPGQNITAVTTTAPLYSF